jgi:signal transduction histidine kinase
MRRTALYPQGTGKFFYIALALSFLILFIDIFLPRGYLEWILYIVPILIMYRIENALAYVILLSIIAILMIVGVIYSPDIGVRIAVSITNRIEGLLTFIVFSLLVYRLKKSQTEIRKFNTSLEERTQELAISYKELESFSYSVSHDLRSPLGSIRGFSGMLLEDYSKVLDDDAKDYLHRINVAAEKMNRLIDDLLRLSKITRQEMRIEQVHLSNLAESIVAELHQQDPSRAVQVKIQPDLVTYADPQLIRIALVNLLSNAWKYTSRTGSPIIEMGSRKENGRTVFFIHDNGAGFDMSLAPKLFKPFSRLHSEKEFSGTGIGLAIVHRIIKRHGGELWAEGKVNEGATFTFTLPSPVSL